jgi:hypothetical protein
MSVVRPAIKLACVVCLAAITCAPASFAASKADRFVNAALSLRNPNVVYDYRYRRIAYPLGDVPAGTGVCSDVVVRAYRAIGIDLQQRVHQDMLAHFGDYPGSGA